MPSSWRNGNCLFSALLGNGGTTICKIGRKVSILKVDAQSCLYNMLKSDILASFWRIAFENPFNGN